MSAADFYDRWAGVYDRLATLPPLGRYRERAVDALDLSAGDTVVEMGCGTGANLPLLRERVGPDGRVLGIDLSAGQLRRARRHADRWDNVAVVRADATRPPVERADAVLATFVVGMFAEPAGAVERWLRLCAGRIALLNFQASERAVGRPLGPLFAAFVGVSSPGELSERLRGGDEAVASLDERVRAARRRLAAGTVDRRYEAFALGYLGLLSGTVRPASAGRPVSSG